MTPAILVILAYISGYGSPHRTEYHFSNIVECRIALANSKVTDGGENQKIVMFCAEAKN